MPLFMDQALARRIERVECGIGVAYVSVRQRIEPAAGTTWQDYDGWHEVVAAYVDQGYAVVRVNYRGSTGYGAAWRESLRTRVGFIELEDIGAIRQELELAGVIDPERVAITGFSWGGYLTLMALGTQPKQWRSGAALVPLAVSDQLAPGASATFAARPRKSVSPIECRIVPVASVSTTMFSVMTICS